MKTLIILSLSVLLSGCASTKIAAQAERISVFEGRIAELEARPAPKALPAAPAEPADGASVLAKYVLEHPAPADSETRQCDATDRLLIWQDGWSSALENAKREAAGE